MNRENNMIPIIAIDGPSGSGKGTLAAKIAQHYGFHLLDSGAIYRLLGLKLLKQQRLEHIEQHLSECIAIAENLDIAFQSTEQGLKILLDGQDVTTEIRSETAGANASKVATIPELRTALLQRQRNFAVEPGLVADGRDIGTVIFPQAQIKFYLTASAESRAERRVKQLHLLGQNANIDEILSQIQARDKQDMQRSVAPLIPAEDAYQIDSSMLNIEQVFDLMVQYIDQIRSKQSS